MAEPQLAGQTVVVLGGSAGIGLATAHRARAEGANVVITGRDPERLARAAADVGAIQTAQFDAADEPALQQFFDQLGQQLHGPIGHVLVAAGAPYYAPFAELDVADAMRYVSRALALPLNVARFASPRMGPGRSLTFIGGTGRACGGRDSASSGRSAPRLPRWSRTWPWRWHRSGSTWLPPASWTPRCLRPCSAPGWRRAGKSCGAACRCAG